MQDLHHGQEINLFFFSYGIKGLYGIIISMFVSILVIYKTFYILNKYKCGNYSYFLDEISKGKSRNSTIKIIINMFLLISFFIMVAGFSAYLKQEFNISTLIGSFIITSICGFIFTKNTEGLTKVNSILVPVLIAFILIIGIKSLSNINLNSIEVRNSSNWIISSIIYCSYNSIILIPILVTLKKYVRDEKDIGIICIFSLLILSVLAIVIFILLSKIDIDINTIEMPIVYVASRLGTVCKYMYGGVILASIFTSAVSAGFGFIKNVSDNVNNKLIIIICVAAILVSNFGFSNLVNLLYPIFGYLGLIQLFLILKKR